MHLPVVGIAWLVVDIVTVVHTVVGVVGSHVLAWTTTAHLAGAGVDEKREDMEDRESIENSSVGGGLLSSLSSDSDGDDVRAVSMSAFNANSSSRVGVLALD